MKSKQRSMHQIIEEQTRRWQINSKEKIRKKVEHYPVIYLSREPGSNGRQIAEQVAKELKFDLFDYAIIQKVAESSKMSSAVVETLDEKSRSALLDWIGELSEERHLWFDQYLEHLLKVIGTVGRHGRAVIVGRGAGYIVPANLCLRVRVFASMETKTKRIMERMKLGEKEAKKKIQQIEGEQKAFLKRYFQKDIQDPNNYDLLVNTERLATKEAVAAITAALHSSALWVK